MAKNYDSDTTAAMEGATTPNKPLLPAPRYVLPLRLSASANNMNGHFLRDAFIDVPDDITLAEIDILLTGVAVIKAIITTRQASKQDA